MNIDEEILTVFKLLNNQVIPEPEMVTNSARLYLHPVKCEHNGVQSHPRLCNGWSMHAFVVMGMREYKPRVDWYLSSS